MASKDRCPWCGGEIAHEKFVEIERQIRAEEQTRQDAATAALQLQLQSKHKADLQQKCVAIEKQARESAAKDVAKVTAECVLANKKLKAIEANGAVELKKAMDEAARAAQKDIVNQRASLEKDADLKLRKEQGAFNRERESLQKKMRLMEQQLQKKTANELGDGAEIDLYESLREAFPDDRIKRVAKGQNGPDVIHDVLHKGQVCGRIVIDSKNHKAWQHGFVAKLRQDQMDAKADHAILSSSVFPSGKKEMCIEGGVIVVSPARVEHIVQILRRALLTLYVRGVGNEERATKTTKLYDYIRSETYVRCSAEAGRVAGQLLDLDVDEKKSHDGVWKKRGILANRIRHILRDIDTEIGSIVEGDVEASDNGIRKTPVVFRNGSNGQEDAWQMR